jgi:hypothetical protein
MTTKDSALTTTRYVSRAFWSARRAVVRVTGVQRFSSSSTKKLDRLGFASERPEDRHLPGKGRPILTTSPDHLGGVRSLVHIRGVLTSVGVHVMPGELAVPFIGYEFNGDHDEMTDEKTRGIL